MSAKRYRIVESARTYSDGWCSSRFYPEWRYSWLPIWFRFYRHSVAPATWFGTWRGAENYIDQRAAGVDPDAERYERRVTNYTPGAPHD